MQKSYRVSLLFEKKNKKYLVFSLPQTNHYQEISNLSPDPKALKTISDEWGNKVVCFSLSDVNNITLQFLYTPRLIVKTIQKNWVLRDYKGGVYNTLITTPNQFISGKDPKIIKLSQSLIKKEQNVFMTTRIFYDFVLNYLSYGNPTEGLYPYTQALKEKVTDCGGFSTLLLSLFQSIGIPGRLVIGFVIKNNPINSILEKLRVTSYGFQDFSIHAWCEILLPDNSWFPMDPSVEWRKKHNQSKRIGGFGEIPADRLVTSFGQNFKITIDDKKYMIDLLQLPVYL